ncbi:hypothetical protein ABD91_17910 [Lysinibacillus sphaericus]|uniref:hypothetical protein n=1 Tax=Lysinibacillus sphaericus TaxID=1421 RepID=UPI0018CCCEEA|nr:hypothetical protein [Lysinibacillus sphaericus]MBG9692659.1 hypothetical protein [Lysinibacillus sphaericus]
MNIGYRCMDNPAHSFKSRSKYMDGVRCPLCQRPVLPTGFKEDEYRELPLYEDLKKQCKDSKREMDLKRLESIKRSGRFIRTNRDGPGELVSSLLVEDFDWLVEQLERRMNKGLRKENEQWLKQKESQSG